MRLEEKYGLYYYFEWGNVENQLHLNMETESCGRKRITSERLKKKDIV